MNILAKHLFCYSINFLCAMNESNCILIFHYVINVVKIYLMSSFMDTSQTKIFYWEIFESLQVI